MINNTYCIKCIVLLLCLSYVACSVILICVIQRLQKFQQQRLNNDFCRGRSKKAENMTFQTMIPYFGDVLNSVLVQLHALFTNLPCT